MVTVNGREYDADLSVGFAHGEYHRRAVDGKAACRLLSLTGGRPPLAAVVSMDDLSPCPSCFPDGGGE